ncbi:hypothetical protein VST7929_03311 [Vibrio stylophorae]|uniref:Capsule biosynthesis GfcC-like N-terminal domain-containing protein n=1 Tax=Vibrio stylophorae TaxID=659351 RepID=A0ABN8DZ80_9VIBR|nr:capsule biosynthesis GfcC D2 domain-containing protein [Vibrio stylophorae]CAH0536296.1 hypothetical protein VST7929_03311 [Vibrio stylophorae]
MKKLYRLFFTAIIFSLSGQLVLAQQHALTQQQTRLTVKTSSQERAKSQLIFEGSPRVSQLIDEGLKLRPKTLQSAHQTSGVYWLGSGLFEQSRPDNALSTSLTQTLQQLTQLEQSAVKNENMPRALSIQSLTQFLNRSVFKPRVNVTIDPDLYLLGNAVNPQISGDLLLLLPTRPNHVWVTGNVVKNDEATFSSDAIGQRLSRASKHSALYGAR